ncbi:GNAT domain [Dillenia turbinata]|uniref:GNAT domain n=1 Tax=Dillenia turbinata TaxID=194707 RepID=A0AAN8UMI3_9MAGN
MEENFSEITLRPLDLSDVDDFMEWATDDRVSRYCSWEPYTSKKDALNYIRDIIVPHPWYRAICIHKKPVGAISVKPYFGNDGCRAQVGYGLAFKYWGKGIATRAVELAAMIVFKEYPNLERLEGLVDVDNVGSQRVLEKAGFVREGVLRKYMIMKDNCRDMVMFSLVATDLRRQMK